MSLQAACDDASIGRMLRGVYTLLVVKDIATATTTTATATLLLYNFSQNKWKKIHPVVRSTKKKDFDNNY